MAEVVRAHVENAAQFWVLAERARALPEGDPEAVKWKRRLAGQLHGLRLAGPAALPHARALAVDTCEAPEVFVLAWVALHARDGALADVPPLVEAAPDAMAGFAGAVQRSSAGILAPHVARWLASARWPERAAGLSACARWGQSVGTQIGPLLADPSPQVRAAALRLPEAAGHLAARLADEVPAVRVVAATAILTGAQGQAGTRPDVRQAAVAALRALAADADLAASQPDLWLCALDHAVLAAAPSTLAPWIRALWDSPATAPVALRAAGIHGDPKSWAHIVAQMAEPALALAAGLAAADLLGVDPVEGDLFTADPARLPPDVARRHDLDFTLLPDPAAFARALAEGRLAPATGEDRSSRARACDGLRQRLGAG